MNCIAINSDNNSKTIFMLQKSTYILVLIVIFIVGTSAGLYSHIPPQHSTSKTTGVFFSFRPPQGYTGATSGMTCGNVGCHNSFAVNSVGGNVNVVGLPTVYTPGATYNFSLTITHGAADRTRWGFSIAARNTLNTVSLGTFSSTNPNASPNGNELSHGALPSTTAPITAAQNSYTFNNLEWTAPLAGGAVTFYFAGVASDNANANAGDYVYTASTTSGALPISLYSFDAVVKNNNVLLSWQTAQEINSNYFKIQKSEDNSQFIDIGKVDASGNSSLAKSYSFTDNNPFYFEKPIYYRLEMVDKDGSKTYSKIENIVLKATSTYIKSIYPNPLKAGSTLHVNLVSKDNEVVLIKLIDNDGRLIKSMELNAQKGSNILDVRMPVNAIGNYRLVVNSSAGVIQEPLIIR